jgi:SAM-dependent methyltransferase
MQQQALWSRFQNERTDLFTGAYWRLERLVHYASTRYKAPDVVNIGTGDGYLERHAARLGWHVTAIDPDERAINRLRAAGVDGRVGVVERIPLPDSSADVVFSSEVFEHLSEDSLIAGLAEIARVLRPGGRLIGTVPYGENLAQQECVCPGCGLSFHRWCHLQSFTPERLANLLAANFTIERCGPVYFPSWKMMDLRSKVNATLRIALLNPLGIHRSNENILFVCRKR